MAGLDVLARDLARDIRKVARRARSEEDLRIGVEELLKPALRELDVDATPRYEKSYAPHGSILSGRSDAVYGRVVIEYEPVGALARAGGVNHAAEQLDRYLQAEAGHGAADAMRRVIGVGLDGERIFFLRYRRGGGAIGTTQPRKTALPLFPDLGGATQYEPPEGRFQILGPYDVSEDSVQTFLLYLRALRRRPLTPELLAEEFGPKGSVARGLVPAFYEALTQSSETKVKTFFAE